MSSTGTPVYFIHAGEALHGDLGMITEDEIVLAISYDGEIEELIKLVPAVKRIEVELFALTSNPNSTSAKRADLELKNTFEKEACHLDLTPTSINTAALALGDALPLGLTYLRGLESSDFALYHPEGNLEHQLLTTVEDVLEVREQNPRVGSKDSVQKVLYVMTDSRMGSTSVVDESGKLIGIITDGNIRHDVKEENRELL